MNYVIPNGRSARDIALRERAHGLAKDALLAADLDPDEWAVDVEPIIDEVSHSFSKGASWKTVLETAHRQITDLVTKLSANEEDEVEAIRDWTPTDQEEV